MFSITFFSILARSFTSGSLYVKHVIKLAVIATALTKIDIFRKHLLNLSRQVSVIFEGTFKKAVGKVKTD